MVYDDMKVMRMKVVTRKKDRSLGPNLSKIQLWIVTISPYDVWGSAHISLRSHELHKTSIGCYHRLHAL